MAKVMYPGAVAVVNCISATIVIALACHAFTPQHIGYREVDLFSPETSGPIAQSVATPPVHALERQAHQTADTPGDQGIGIVRHFEGLRLTAYRDKGGKLTIGYGDTHDVHPGMTITREEAERRLQVRYQEARALTDDLAPKWLSANRTAAIASLIYNIGGDRFATSKLRVYLAQHETVKAAREFLAWSCIDGELSDGLISRRMAEMQLFIRG